MRSAWAILLLVLTGVSAPWTAAAQTPGEVFRKVTP